MPRLILPLAVALLLFTGCDSGGDDGDGGPGDFTQTCADIGDTADGTMTATVESSAFTGTCFEVYTLSGNLYVRGTTYTFGRDGSIARGAEITLIVDDAELGQTEIGQVSGTSSARYTTPNGSEVEAVSGQVSLAEFSATRARGTFAFTTVNGIEVTRGAFSIAP